MIDTQLLQDKLDPTPLTVQEHAEKVPMHRAGEAHEIATVVAFLLGSDASYITVRSFTNLCISLPLTDKLTLVGCCHPRRRRVVGLIAGRPRRGWSERQGASDWNWFLPGSLRGLRSIGAAFHFMELVQKRYYGGWGLLSLPSEVHGLACPRRNSAGGVLLFRAYLDIATDATCLASSQSQTNRANPSNRCAGVRRPAKRAAPLAVPVSLLFLLENARTPPYAFAFDVVTDVPGPPPRAQSPRCPCACAGWPKRSS